MTKSDYEQEGEMSPQEMKAYAGQQAKFFNFILQVIEENERLRQRMEALESENAALTDTLSFMDYDPRRMDVVRVSKNDQGMFSQCREIAMKVAEEQGNASLQRE